MSAKTSTPPQAYTRETLTKAFEWMKSQPESIKDKIVSADSLVRFYLHSKRFGSPTLALLDDRQPNLEDLISVENFKQDLKDLAQGLKQFEEPAEPNVPFQARPVDLSVNANLRHDHNANNNMTSRFDHNVTHPTQGRTDSGFQSSYKTSAAVSEPRPSTKSVDSGRMQEQNYAYSSRIAEHTAPQAQKPMASYVSAPQVEPVTQQNYANPSQQYYPPHSPQQGQTQNNQPQAPYQQQHYQPQAPYQQHYQATSPQDFQAQAQPSYSNAPKEASMNYSQQMPPSQAFNNSMPSSAWNNSMPSQDSTMGPALTLAFDEKTFMAVKAVKERFNLSSDQEALRMLVATGFDRLREGFLKGF